MSRPLARDTSIAGPQFRDAHGTPPAVPQEPEDDVLSDLLDVFWAGVGTGDILSNLFGGSSRRGISGPRTTNSRGRPLSPKTLEIRDALAALTERFDRMTVRQCFYQLEMAGVVEKTEGGYKQVQRQVLRMRHEDLLAWDFITDGTRWQRKPASYDDVRDYIEQVSRSYCRDLWQGQDVRIEIWLEKDALADVIVEPTRRWDVSLMVSRGQSSVTFLHNAAMFARTAYAHAGVATWIYAMYDHDAGGERAFQAIERQLPEFAPGVPIHVERLAVTEAQIEQWSLPTRPPKAKDPDAKKWGNRPAVELDAIDPVQLTQLVEDAVVRHVDEHAWSVQQAVEREEREGLLALAEGLGR